MGPQWVTRGSPVGPAWVKVKVKVKDPPDSPRAQAPWAPWAVLGGSTCWALGPLGGPWREYLLGPGPLGRPMILRPWAPWGPTGRRGAPWGR